MTNSIENLISDIDKSLHDQSFVKMSLGNYKGKVEDLKAIFIKLITIKNNPKLSFTYRYKTKDIVKNYSFEESFSLLRSLLIKDGFCFTTVYTLNFDLTFTVTKNGGYKLNKKDPSNSSLPPLTHDKQKNRKITAAGKQYLQELKITDKEGNVYKNAQDKFRQINHYVEILSTLLQKLPSRDVVHVVDMGAGKGYLTFALYDYLTNVLKVRTDITGVEYRQDLVDLCNTVAKNAHFEHLTFVKGTIEEYANPNMNVLIALHACDTATDDAIAKGLNNHADLIVVAPCCHKQIRREIEKNKTHNELDFLTRHGIFLERQSEMVTDGIRAMILEYYGYSTKVFEFISDAHTPKNILIVGSKKRSISNSEKDKIFMRIQKTKEYFGIDQHHLEKIMGLASLV